MYVIQTDMNDSSFYQTKNKKKDQSSNKEVE